MPTTPPRARVLYVEDDPLVAELVQEALAATCDVTLARDGFTALEQANASPPDLLLVDLHLPTLGGFEVVRRWRRTPSLTEIPVVVVSARVLREEALRARELGCAAFVEKPFTLETLRAAVSDALATARPVAPTPR